MTDVDDAMQAITRACDPDAEIITGANYGPPDMKDSITISVIATCFKDSFDVGTGDRSVAEELINNTTNTGKASAGGNSFTDFLTSRTGSTGNNDAYDELEQLFSSRK